MTKTESIVGTLLRVLRIPALMALGGLAAANAQSLVGNSPFMPAGSAAGASAPAEAYELAGSAVDGNDITVCIFERQAKHSRWIPVGQTEDGVKVLSFDARTDKAVVTINGAQKDLYLRKAVAAAPAPAYAFKNTASGSSQVAALVPITPTAPATPEAQAKEQSEARMLVSDLLEIGVQQRKAYQDAKQKAASETPSQPSN